MKILLVEDDIKLGKTTLELLKYENCFVDWSEDGLDAINVIKSNLDINYDIIILDWMLPELSGIEICKLLRNKYNYQGGIIFVTAKGEVDDCVRALELGADDYIVKPFKIKELIARLKAVSRRKSKPFVDKIYTKKGVKINTNLHTVIYNEKELHLNKKVFNLFEELFINLNITLPRSSLFEKIWQDKPDTNMESLDSHIYMLRKSLRVFPNIQIKLIKNIGYRMEINDD